MGKRTSLWAGLCCALAIALGTGAVGAQPKDKGKAAPKLDVKGLSEKLKGGEGARLAEALAAIQGAGPAGAPLAGLVEEILRRGHTTETTKAAIEALGAVGQPSSSAVLRPYVKHRVQDIRRAAVKALVATKGSEAVLAFKEGLRSKDAMVRGFSATGLGNLNVEAALPDLFLALDHDVLEAAAAIGQLCKPKECETFAGKLGKLGLDVMTSGFDPILFRHQPLGDDLLLRIVGQLRELGTSEAGKYLADVQARWPKAGSPKVKQAIDGAVASLPGAK